MNQVEDRKAVISARVQEHYDYLVAAGYDVVFTALQGSQNYGLDEYSNDYCSDIDTKSIVLPCLDDFIRAKQPISAVEILENNEHAEVKDIRVMFEMFKKENISYIELLYSDYVVFNPKYEKLIKPIFKRRDEIVTADLTQFLKCIAGMAYEKDILYITDFSNGRPIAECYKPAEMYKLTLMNYKKQLDENGAEMSVDEARNRSAAYAEKIKYIKDELIEDRDYGINEGVWVFLDEIKAKILKFKITEDVCFDIIEQFKRLSNNMIHPDDEFKKTEVAAIEKLKVQPQDNIFDYYEEDEDETKI